MVLDVGISKKTESVDNSSKKIVGTEERQLRLDAIKKQVSETTGINDTADVQLQLDIITEQIKKNEYKLKKQREQNILTKIVAEKERFQNIRKHKECEHSKREEEEIARKKTAEEDYRKEKEQDETKRQKREAQFKEIQKCGCLFSCNL